MSVKDEPRKRPSVDEDTNDAKVRKMEACNKTCHHCSDLSRKVANLEDLLEKQQQTFSISFNGINSKVDKLVRLLSDLTEKEAKMTKNLATLSKLIEKQEEKAKPNASKSVGVFLQNLHQKENAPAREAVQKEPYSVVREPVNALDELKWGQNTFFLGDSVFSMMMQVEEIKKKFDYSFSSSSSYGKEKNDDSSFEIDE